MYGGGAVLVGDVRVSLVYITVSCCGYILGFHIRLHGFKRRFDVTRCGNHYSLRFDVTRYGYILRLHVTVTVYG